MKPPVRRTLFGAVAAGVIGITAAVPAAASAETVSAPPVPVLPAFAATPPAPLLHALPAPLACLVTTGFAAFCLGIT
ncbi:hypothetical protein [Nocardia pneumoniae]|uniref:hypothetical protein n=1 Tax=Nocardia pneumoniae TaxID=228601 RepID=UPI0002E52D35|nr:hypothetical protein [Nocardia pneumoniae]